MRVEYRHLSAVHWDARVLAWLRERHPRAPRRLTASGKKKSR
jgi:hypothetical protein